MVTPELLDYIKEQLRKVEPEDNIKSQLHAKGWDEAALNEAFSQIHTELKKKPGFFSMKVRWSGRKQLIWLGVILLVGLLIGTGAIYAYFNYYMKPERVMGRAIAKTFDASTFEFVGNLKVAYQQSENSPSAIKLPLNFTLAYTGIYKAEENQNAKISAQATANAGNVTIAEFNLKRLSPYLFVQINSLSELGFIDNSKILTKWIQIDLTKIPLNDQVLASVLKEIDTKNQTALISAVTDNFPFAITHRFEDEPVDGIDSYHYQYLVDKANLQKVLVSLSVESNSQNEKELSDRLEHFDIKPGELWVNKHDGTIRRLTFAFTRRGLEKDSPVIDFAGDIRLHNYEETPNIQAPQSSMRLEDIIKDVVNFKTLGVTK